ncbi:hypothetical protein CEXT_524551 [Caerostris extrusa]|uniref:Uncharacterized protein n=1 Tax=Caerostris extrusa TaxID=172846 RepID=A0AAV4RK02_CAEEX|nr:hypothetical protein CEXT_524551 [Caerostris extrusa]
MSKEVKHALQKSGVVKDSGKLPHEGIGNKRGRGLKYEIVLFRVTGFLIGCNVITPITESDGAVCVTVDKTLLKDVLLLSFDCQQPGVPSRPQSLPFPLYSAASSQFHNWRELDQIVTPINASNSREPLGKPQDEIKSDRAGRGRHVRLFIALLGNIIGLAKTIASLCPTICNDSHPLEAHIFNKRAKPLFISSVNFTVFQQLLTS